MAGSTGCWLTALWDGCSGNFKTLEQAILEYGADAMRIALADAGDAMDDANFEHQTANGAILRLTKEVGALSP